MNWRIERLDRTHGRSDFDCGEPSLNDFLSRYATQYEKRNIGRTFVLVAEGDQRVVGYYTLAGGEVQLDDLPDEIAKKLPRHPIPVIRLARLAVDTTVRGTGLGGMLLKDALTQCKSHSEMVAAFAVIVDAIDDEAARFYERFGFSQLVHHADRLFLPISTLRSA